MTTSCISQDKINFGSGALSGKMLLVGMINNNKTAVYFRAG